MPIRILIADDNASVRGAMRQVLEAAGEHWEILEAENGEEAVSKTKGFIPNLIIMDLVMPVMDGLTAAKHIGHLLPDIPILMHTLYPFPQVKIEAERAGVRRVVPKSDSSVLVSAVEHLLSPQPAESLLASADSASKDMVTPLRRTEDKIREWCTALFETKDDEAHAAILVDLQKALHEHIEQLRARVAEYPVGERRFRDGVRRAEPPILETAVPAIPPVQPGPIPAVVADQPQKPPPKTSTGGSN